MAVYFTLRPNSRGLILGPRDPAIEQDSSSLARDQAVGICAHNLIYPHEKAKKIKTGVSVDQSKT